MRLNDLINVLETQRKVISEVKIKAVTITALNKIDIDKKVLAKFDSAINHISKMIISAYTGIKYKIPYEAYDDKKPYFNGGVNLRENYSADTEMSLCVGLLNNTSNELKKLVNLTQTIDHSSMTQIKLKSAFIKSREASIENLASVAKSIDGIIVTEEEK